MIATVYLRGEKITKEIDLESNFNLDNEEEIIEKWQNILNLIAEIVNVPSALIMRITDKNMEVFLRDSGEDNPYKVKGSDSLGHGLYCETVIGLDKELLIDDALKYKDWKDNPDTKLNMISYYGVPIKWPNQKFFGTICILDSKKNSYNEKFKTLIKEFKNSLEKDLILLTQKMELKYLSETDYLTSIYNRRKINEIIEKEFKHSKKTNEIFSIAIFDLNKFKEINDNYGHDTGDNLLQIFSNEIIERIRSTDYFGRIGGDEFILICPNTNYNEIKSLIKELEKKVINKMNKTIINNGFSYGIAEFLNEDKDKSAMLKRADLELYKNK